MAENENDKTHVLMQDCIISQFGRCEAGHMLSEADVDAGTWTWLNNRRFIKSVEDIEQEADSEQLATQTAEILVEQETDSEPSAPETTEMSVEQEADSEQPSAQTTETPVVPKARSGKKNVRAVE